MRHLVLLVIALAAAGLVAARFSGAGWASLPRESAPAARLTGLGAPAGPGSRSVPGSLADSGNPTGARPAAALACAPRPVATLGADFFADISEASGIRAENTLPTRTPVPTPAEGPTPTVEPFIPTNCHPRVQFVDLNGDGYDDAIAHSMFLNPMNSKGAYPYEHLVYLNNGDRTFRNFSTESGLRNVQSGLFIFGDVDNDGDEDAFAPVDFEWPDHANSLWLNDGHGHFTQKPDSGLEGTPGKTRGANGVFADFDNDGDLDLFLGNGQTSYYDSTNNFYLGNGDGTFVEATDRLGPQVEHPAAGSVACDYDNDGDQDIFVANYGISGNLGADVLFENDGHARFVNVATARGFDAMPTGNYFQKETDYGRAIEPGKQPGEFVGGNGFGIQCEDVNNDGLLDVFVGNISHPAVTDTLRWWSDPSTLLINQGRAGGYAFKNEFLDRGISYNEGDIDVGMVDFDNDGRMDLSVTREVKYETRPAFTDQEQKGWFGLFAQLPDGKFKSVGLASGINDREMKEPLLNRLKGTGSHSWSDIDRDGDMDLYVGGCGGAWRPNFLFENRIGSRQDWVGIKLRGDGKTVNRDAIGAKAVLKWPDGRQLMRTVKSSRGHYNSMDMQTLHFGLGDLGCDYRVEVTWPNGKVSRYTAEEVMRNRYVTLNYADVAHEPPQPRLYLPRALRQGIGE